MKKILFFTLILFVLKLSYGQVDNFLISSKGTFRANTTLNTILEKDLENVSVTGILINKEILLNKQSFSLEIEGEIYNLHKDQLTGTSTDNCIFSGTNNDGNGHIMLSIFGNDIQGTIVQGKKVYQIETTPEGDYVLIKKDFSLVKETCGVKENVERGTPKVELHKDNIKIAGVEYEERSNNSDNFLRAAESHECKIRVLILFTEAAKNSVSNITNTIKLAIAESNQVLTNSGINYQLELAVARETDYNEVDITIDLDKFKTFGENAMDEVFSLRNIYAADICVLLTDESTPGYFGLAVNSGVTAKDAFCVVDANHAIGPRYTLIHEIGHLVGCRHDDDTATTPYAYGHGYVFPVNNWRTIMAKCSGCTRLPYFSNPNKTFNGYSMGTNSSNDNTRVWNENSEYVMTFSQPIYNDLTLSTFSLLNNHTDLIALNSIKTNNFIYTPNSGWQVNLRAGNFIELNPGFTSSQTNFSAIIEHITPCGSSLRADPIPTVGSMKDPIDEHIEEYSYYQIFPNPTNGTFKISAESEISDVQVFGVDGRLLKSYNTTAKIFDIDISQYTNGVYLVKFKHNGQWHNERVIKE